MRLRDQENKYAAITLSETLATSEARPASVNSLARLLLAKYCTRLPREWQSVSADQLGRTAHHGCPRAATALVTETETGTARKLALLIEASPMESVWEEEERLSKNRAETEWFRSPLSVQRSGIEADIFFPGHPPFPVLSGPGLPASARSGIAGGKS